MLLRSKENMMNALFPQAQVSLVFLNGPLTNQSRQINKREIRIGSGTDSDIVIPDPSILPLHAVLHFEN